jgi:hypothetical protein
MPLIVWAPVADNRNVAYVADSLARKGEETSPRLELGRGLRAAIELVREADAISASRRFAADESFIVSPELALVCPELRRQAIERLPERDQDDFLSAAFRQVRSTMAPHATTAPNEACDGPDEPSASLAIELQQRRWVPRRPSTSTLSAAGVYLVAESVRVAICGALTVGAVIGAATLASVLRT